jgi:gliding motility-associated-like protein
MSNQLKLTDCQTPFKVAAPDNFDSYLWDNGDQTRITTRTTTGGMWCRVTSATGCQFTLSGYVTTGAVTTPAFIQDIICEGESYNANYFSLPSQPPGVHKYYNTFINPATCDDSQTTELELTVIQRYNHIKAAICHGNDYTQNGFNITQPAVGVRRDTVKIGNTAGCDEYNVLELTVNISFEMPDIIIGDDSPCTGELVNYTFTGSETLTKFEWVFPDNAVVTKGRYTSQVTLYYTNNTPGQLVLKGENGCNTGSAQLPVHPRQTHNIQLNEQVCQGDEYNRHNFNLGVRDIVGYFVYEKHLKSSLGCDSSVTLALNVLPVPVVRIEPKDPVLCNPGDEIALYAITGDMEWDEEDENDGDYPFVFIYDCKLDYLWNTGETTASITKNPTGTTTYTVTVTTESNCSATASQTVVVNTHAPQTINAGICEGETYNGFGFTENKTGTYTKTVSQDNCSVLLTLNLTVHPAYHNTIRDVACYGVPYQKHGMDFTLYKEGLHVETFRFLRATGCDSLVTFEIEVHPSPVTPIRDTICQNQTYAKHGFTLPAQVIAGEHTYTLPLSTSKNCDSTVILNLLVNPLYVNIISDEDTIGNRYKKYGFDKLLTTTGLQSHTLYLKSKTTDCDSTVILNLNVVDRTTVLNKTICQNDSYFFKNEYLNTSGVYRDTLQGAFGNDSIILLNLTVHPVDMIKLPEKTIYIGKGYFENGFNIPPQYAKGPLSDTLFLQNRFDCDSTVILNLEVICPPPVETPFYETVCLGESYSGHGFVLPSQGVAGNFIHQRKLTDMYDCDSTVTLYLTVKPLQEVTLNARVTINEPYNANGFSVPPQPEPGLLTFKHTDKDNYGCDSVTILNLEVVCPLPAETPYYETVCQGESYSGHGFTLPPYNVPGSYTHQRVLIDVHGCDSIIMLYLTVKPLSEKSFTARIPINEPYNADGFSVPPQPEPGFFTFERRLKDHYGCDSVLTLHLTTYVEIIPDEYFSPNGDGIKDVWNIKNIEYFEVASVEIYDRFGKLLMRCTGNFTPWDGNYLGNPMPSTDYWYVIILKEEEKQYVGHFTLIR